MLLHGCPPRAASLLPPPPCKVQTRARDSASNASRFDLAAAAAAANELGSEGSAWSSWRRAALAQETPVSRARRRCVGWCGGMGWGRGCADREGRGEACVVLGCHWVDCQDRVHPHPRNQPCAPSCVASPAPGAAAASPHLPLAARSDPAHLFACGPIVRSEASALASRRPTFEHCVEPACSNFTHPCIDDAHNLRCAGKGHG